MINGMTGFGSAQLLTNKIKAVVEIKSLNHRYFDVNFYLPMGFGYVENKIRQIMQKHIQRGRVSVSLKIFEKPDLDIRLNQDIVRKHLAQAKRIASRYHLKNNLTLADIIKLPGVLETKDVDINVDKIWPSLERVILKALAGLKSMRRSEGRSLARDMSDKLRRMLLQINKIRLRSKSILRSKKKSLTTEEFQVYQKSSDINEEISRLVHYVDEIKLLFKATISVGKRIDFIAQEMQRETNTIGSKLQDKVVSNAVIALKSKIEKIREQAQNVE